MVRIQVLLAAFVAVLPCSSSASPLSDHLDAVVADGHLNSVVKIYAGPGGGYGFIFGRQADTIWIATAAHVIYSEHAAASLQPEPYSDIIVKTRGHADAWPLAGRPVLADGDVTFIPVRIPLSVGGFDAWQTQIVELYAKTGDKARLTVSPTAIGYPDGTGTIGQAADGSATVTGLPSGMAGDSGAPVISGRGIVGMYVVSAGNQMIPIQTIRRSARLAGLPWTLTDFPAPSVPVHLCLTVTGSVHSQDLTVSGETGPQHPGPDSCVDTKSGPAMIGTPGLFVSCSPQTLNLPEQENQSLPIDCDVNLEGLWDGGAYGALRITASDAGSWRFEGLPAFAGGWIKGVAYLRGAKLGLQGISQSGLAVSGSLNVEARRLSGAVRTGPSSTSIELTR